MPEAARVGHKHSGIGKLPPSPAEEGSPNVFIGGKPVLRAGDHFADGSAVESGALNVTINGKQAARLGDKVNNGAKVDQGCERVWIGDGGGPGFGELQTLRRKLVPTATDVHKTLLCVPKIAVAMAGKEPDPNERQGWIHLRDMMTRWLTGAPNDDGKKDLNPFWIEWDWVIGLKQYHPAVLLAKNKVPVPDPVATSPREEYEAFIKPFPSGNPFLLMPPEDLNMEIKLEPSFNIYNTPAKEKLGEILADERTARGATGRMDFDHTISSDAEWKRIYNTLLTKGWQDKYYTRRPVPFPFGISGQQAALGSFQFRALARGWCEPSGDEKLAIHVTGVSIFVRDVFNFDAQGFEWLGCWSCEEGDVTDNGVPYTSICAMRGYTGLNNSDLRHYRIKYGLGHDYLVLSKPHSVAPFEVMVYEYPL